VLSIGLDVCLLRRSYAENNHPKSEEFSKMAPASYFFLIHICSQKPSPTRYTLHINISGKSNITLQTWLKILLAGVISSLIHAVIHDSATIAFN
jgi:hypothetical protein